AAEAAKARYARMITGFREEQKEQAKQELAAALAEEKQAEEELTRLRQASGAGVVSQTDFSIALMVRDRAPARGKSARASYDLMMNGNRPEEIAEAQAEADRAEAHYQMLKNGTRLEDKAAAYAALNEAQAALNEAEANLREAAVVAPERCVIETLPV